MLVLSKPSSKQNGEYVPRMMLDFAPCLLLGLGLKPVNRFERCIDGAKAWDLFR